MVRDVFGGDHGSGDRDILHGSRKAYTDIFDRICDSGYWEICLSCNFHQLYLCGSYDRDNFLFTGDRTYKGEPFHYRTAPDISPRSAGMAVPLYGFKCCVVDVPCHGDHRQHDRRADRIDF